MPQRSEAFGHACSQLLHSSKKVFPQKFDERLVAWTIRSAFVKHGKAPPINIGFEEIVIQGSLVEERQRKRLPLVIGLVVQLEELIKHVHAEGFSVCLSLADKRCRDTARGTEDFEAFVDCKQRVSENRLAAREQRPDVPTPVNNLS